MPTLEDVASRAGVSIATVSRVLRGHGGIAAETRARVLEAVKALAYQPNILAQGLRLGRGRQVALLVGDIEQSVYAALAKHLQAALESIGLELLLFDLQHREDRLQRLLQHVVSLRLRGVIIATSDPIRMSRLQVVINNLRQRDIAIISVNQNLSRYDIPSVYHDDAGAARKAVAYLLERGHAPIAFLGRTKTSAIGRERFRGYRAGLSDAGLALDESLVWNWEAHYRYEAGYRALTTALQDNRSARSLLCASDDLALGVMAAALDRGLRVPDDLSIIGFGGISWGEHVRPALTTLSSDPGRIGAHVRALFMAQEDGRTLPLRSVVARSLVVRQSTV